MKAKEEMRRPRAAGSGGYGGGNGNSGSNSSSSSVPGRKEKGGVSGFGSGLNGFGGGLSGFGGGLSASGGGLSGFGGDVASDSESELTFSSSEGDDSDEEDLISVRVAQSKVDAWKKKIDKKAKAKKGSKTALADVPDKPVPDAFKKREYRGLRFFWDRYEDEEEESE
jgi:hypothetical protein